MRTFDRLTRLLSRHTVTVQTLGHLATVCGVTCTRMAAIVNAGTAAGTFIRTTPAVLTERFEHYAIGIRLA